MQNDRVDRVATILEIYKTLLDEYVKTVNDSEVHL